MAERPSRVQGDDWTDGRRVECDGLWPLSEADEPSKGRGGRSRGMMWERRA
jgi:hypothetical protein